ncbi:Bcr/CflA family drug resistance efflux transporter [Halopseudomonas aestusnigri]|uniref:multidrug effflux MFS transporter n=1 Tax=Halopseudomonas TaxID=2901189 RepID=UPI0022B6499D|nr:MULTISPECIES: multidrug effflux MFS transporter [Halopseudomonas]BDX19445.1 Bcr/CflA family drug resistance efflux transporter [Halopseudomonas aestusnigri]
MRTSTRTLVLLSGLAAVGTLSTTIILPSFPAMAASLNAAPADMALTLSSFFLVFAVGQLLVGPLSDRYGRRPLILGGLTLFVLGSLLGAGATDLSTMVAARVIQAAGVCAASVLARAVARDLYDGPLLAKALAFIMVAMAAAPGFSPLIGSVIDSQFGWRTSFVLVAAAGSALILSYSLLLNETHAPSARLKMTVAGTATAYLQLLGDRRFALPALSVSLVIGGLYAFFASAPAIMIRGMGYSSLQLGVFFAATVLVVFSAGILAPRLAQRWGAIPVVIIGSLLALSGGVSQVLLHEGQDLLQFCLAICLFLAGMGVINPLGTAVTLQPFAEQAGLASSLLGFLQMTVAAIGTGLISAIALPPSLTLGLLLSAAALCSLGGFLLYSAHREPQMA